MKSKFLSLVTVIFTLCLTACNSSSDTHEHTFNSAWTHDETYHWHSATCGHDVVSDKTLHSFKVDVSNPTFEEDGFTTYTCEICNYSYSVKTADKLSHSFEAGWSHDETTHWHACTDVGYESLRSGEANHSFVNQVINPTFEEHGYTIHSCSVCGYSYQDNETNTLTHNYADGWSHDETTHWHVCTDSGYETLKSGEALHSFDTIVTPATGQSGGYTTHTCSVCGYSFIDNETDPLTYTIIWKNWDGTVLETDKNVAYGAMPSFDGTIPTKNGNEQYFYSFVGWSPEISEVTKDTEYTAQFSENTKSYNVVWKNWDGTILETDENVAYGETPTYDGKTPTKNSSDLYSYSFIGWSPEISNVTKDTEYTAQFSETQIAVQLTIYYTLYNPKTSLPIDTFNSLPTYIGDVSASKVYNFNTQVNLHADTNEGYSFVGWYYNGLIISNEANYNYMMWDENVVLEARFAYTQYSLHVYSNNSDNGLIMIKNGHYNSYVSEDTVNEYYTEAITIAAYTSTTVRFLGWFDSDNTLVSPNAVYSFDMPNKDFEIQGKWDYFTVSYELNGGINNPNNPTSFTSNSGTLSLSNPSRTGYDFICWKYNGQTVTEVNSSWLDNITLTAVWSATQYSINYILDNGTNSNFNPSAYTIEDETIILQDAIKTGYDFVGWYSENSFVNKVTQIQKGTYGDLVLFAWWNDINYIINYDLNGGINNDSNPSIYTIEDEIILANPSRQGYDFVGWYDENDNEITKISIGSYGDKYLSAKWTASLNSLTISSESEEKGTTNILSGNGYSNENITIKASPAEGFVFKGWYDSENCLVSTANPFTFVMPTSSYHLTAKFITFEDKANAEKGLIPFVDTEERTVEYGLYPQTLVTDNNLLDSLNSLGDDQKCSNGWYLYNGLYYAKTEAESPQGSNHQFTNGTEIVGGTTYWFKCEPIIWDLLENKNGELLILSTYLIDQFVYYPYTSERTDSLQNKVYPPDYKNSDVRAWLNNGTVWYSNIGMNYSSTGFFATAFAFGNDYVQTTNVDNSAATTRTVPNKYASSNTNDKVFLLSYQDYLNPNYGFSENTTSCEARKCKVTDWARARGGYFDDNGYGEYWTRSPHASGANPVWVEYVDYNGNISFQYCSRASTCIRPAMKIVY